MSNLIKPRYPLSYLRAEFPEQWTYVQQQIEEVLRHPPPSLAVVLRRRSPAQAHAAIEQCLDAGTLQFVDIPGGRGYFGVLVYDPEQDHYLVFAEDGSVHRPEDACWAVPEDDDE